MVDRGFIRLPPREHAAPPAAGAAGLPPRGPPRRISDALDQLLADAMTWHAVREYSLGANHDLGWCFWTLMAAKQDLVHLPDGVGWWHLDMQWRRHGDAGLSAPPDMASVGALVRDALRRCAAA